jgi:septum formation inhibitor MinC
MASQDTTEISIERTLSAPISVTPIPVDTEETYAEKITRMAMKKTSVFLVKKNLPLDLQVGLVQRVVSHFTNTGHTEEQLCEGLDENSLSIFNKTKNQITNDLKMSSQKGEKTKGEKTKGEKTKRTVKGRVETLSNSKNTLIISSHVGSLLSIYHEKLNLTLTFSGGITLPHFICVDNKDLKSIVEFYEKIL